MSRPDNPDLYLARRLDVSTDRPTRLVVEVDGQTREVTDFRTHHQVPILGLHADRAYEGSGVLVDLWGRQVTFSVAFETPELPVVLPDVHLLALDPNLVEPGHTLIGFHVEGGGPTAVVIYDDALAPVWVLDSPEPFSDLRLSDDGHLLALQDGDAVEMTLLGEVRRRWTRSPVHPADILWEGGKFSYDMQPLEDGFASVTFETLEVPAYPIDYDEPEVLGGAAVIRVPNIVQVGWDGTLREKWPLSDRIDTTRISYNALNWHAGSASWDWAHANAIAPTPDGFLVSLRHQDAVIKLDTRGDLMWILGDPAGWSEAFEAYLLAPVGELEWPYHQHAPMRSATGEIVLFDNHNRGYTPYEVPEHLPETTARVVAYRVNTEEMTVEQVWSRRDTAAGSITSPVMGDADWLSETGHVLATFASTTHEDGVLNSERGWGENAVRLVEYVPGSSEVALDVRFSSDADANPDGWWAPRAERIPPVHTLGSTP